MPGNGLGDRVRNFFAQVNSLQGQHHSQAAEGNWPVLNSNFWVSSQRQVDLLNSNNINYSSGNSDIDRDGSYPLHVTHSLNFTQSNLRPDFAKSQSQNEQPNLNGFMYENQFHQTRSNEANFLKGDRDSDQHHFIASKGFSFLEQQHESGPDRQAKSSVRLETSGSPVCFDLFGGQQKISHQQSSTPQPLQRQLSGTNSMQQLQQQLMIREMQELQRQQQLQQLDLRQQNLINEVTPFAKQTSGSQSTFVNSTPNSDTLQYPWAAERGTSWLYRGSPTMQGSPNEHGFQPNLGQTQRLADLVPQQVDPSLHGVPISSSRGLPFNQYSQLVTARSSMPQMSISSDYLQGNQHNLLPDQVGVQNEYSISRHKSQNENMFGLASGQSLNTGTRNMGGLQQLSSTPRNVLQQEFLGRQEPAVRPATSHEKLHVASPQNEVPLDPTEEKFLFGSDDSMWAAFGKGPSVRGEAGNSFDDGGLSNGLPPIQSGSWSALMQSAVAETSSSDVVPQEEWSGLIFHNNGGPSGSQPPLTHNDSFKRETSLANGNMQIPSSLNSTHFLTSDDVSTTNVMGLNQLREKFNEPVQNLQTEMSERFFQSVEESGTRSTGGPRQNLVAKQSQRYGDSSQNPLQAGTNAKTNSPSWMPGQAGTRSQSNGWNALAAIPHGGDRVTITQEAEKSQQNSLNSQLRVMQGEVIHGSSLWKSNSVPSSAIELGRVNFGVSNHQENQDSLSLKDASVTKSYNARINGETSSFVQSNYLLNQWKNAYPPTRSQDDRTLGRPLHQANDPSQVLNPINSHEKDEVPRNEIENCDGKDNSNDSHRSNLSQHTSGGFREGGLSDVSDSQSLSTGKQKSTNQLPRKVSAPRKFQYHPMGNADEDMEPHYGLKQPTHMSQQNAHFGQSKIFGQVPRNSTVMEKGPSSELHGDTKGTDEEPLHGSLFGRAPTMPVPYSRPMDAHSSSNASSSSQNMLELLHKVDRSRNHGAMMEFNLSECKSSSQLPEAENFDGFCCLQRSQAPVSQGFGLQLGPPSQKLQIPDNPFSSQNGQGNFNSLYSSGAAAGMGDKGQQMVASHLVQPLPSTDETRADLKPSRSSTLGHGRSESALYKAPGDLTSAFHTDTPHSRGNVQNQQITRASGQMSMKQHIDSFNGDASYSAQRRSVEILLPDASGSSQQENLASSGGMYRQSGQNDVQERVPRVSIQSGDHEQISRCFAMPGIGRQVDSVQMLHNMWTNVPAFQHNMGVQFQQVSSHIPEPPRPNIVESRSAPPMQGYVNSEGVIDGEEQRFKESSGQPIASLNAYPDPEMKKALGKASSIKNHSDDSPANSASTQKDIEAFGRSLKPNSHSHQNYSLQNQMQALKDGGTDSSNRASKRLRGPDNVADAQQVAVEAGQQNEHNVVLGDSLGLSSGVQVEDSKILGFSWPPDILQRNTSQQENVASLDSSGLSQNVSQSFSYSDYMTSIPQVSPQMAPSWFNQYGTLKNGQMLQIYDARKVTPLRPGEPPVILGKASSGLDTLNQEEKGTAAPIDACQINNSHQTSSLVANGHVTSPQSSHLNVNDRHLVTLRPKKRKSATSELHPWHKEISEGLQDLSTLSMAAADWNKAANCLTEKVEDDAELIEDGPPVVRSRRRLILTTHLMKQLLRPPPADVLRTDASSTYEIVAYTVSRIALGDACSMASRMSNLDVPCHGIDLFLMKGKLTERNGGQCHAKATEELMGRVRKLENDFPRLDRSASILDLRAECQDLEKFSIINRFARFHGRGQTDNVDTAPTNGNASTQKPIPQRYVTALPMPRSLPDRVQCLSL